MRLLHLFLATLALLAFTGFASADEKSFSKPMQGKNRLDYCFSWQSGCGQAAADAFCVAKGFDKAKAFYNDPGIGGATPTRTIGDNSVCDNNGCDGFGGITCTRPGAGDIYVAPKVNGVRIDWCHAWRKGCGEKAAAEFCKSEGYAGVAKFSKEENVGQTRVLSTGQLCDGGNCDSFKSLQCTN